MKEVVNVKLTSTTHSAVGEVGKWPPPRSLKGVNVSEDLPDKPKIEYGIELEGVYDGVSVWKMSDGSYVNRWDASVRANPGDKGLARRQERVQRWIAARLASEDLVEETPPQEKRKES